MAERQDSWQAIQVLESLHHQVPHPEWPGWVKHAITGERWKSFSSPSKLVLLFSALQEKLTLTEPELKPLLSTDVSEVRITALRLLMIALQKSPEDKALRSLVRAAAAQNPYQFRLEAYEIIGQLPPALKKQFRPELEKCVKKEKVKRVQSACLKIQRSH